MLDAYRRRMVREVDPNHGRGWGLDALASRDRRAAGGAY